MKEKLKRFKRMIRNSLETYVDHARYVRSREEMETWLNFVEDRVTWMKKELKKIK